MTLTSAVVLYGNSVFLAGIRALLARDTALELVAVEDGCPFILDLVRRRHPRAVLFDLTVGQPDFGVALLLEDPNLLLIGLDPSSDGVLILSGRSEQSLTLSDLLGVIQHEVAN